MVNCIRYKGSYIKLRPLKSRKLDFFRINPRSISKMGHKRLIRKGMLSKNQELPPDNPNHFINDYFITHWSKTRFDDGDIHIGFTITVKTISKRANIRNLVKRRLKNAINENIRNFRVRGYDFVFTARGEIVDATYSDIVAQVKRVLNFVEHRLKDAQKQNFIHRKYMDMD
ncbi:ribonuclease P protein component [bacterium]|nr:ribonuclease P protein component [bacterium]